MEQIKTKYITVYALIFILIYMLFFQDYWKTWHKNDTPFKNDVNQYYSYLPAALLYEDLDFEFQNNYWLITAPNGQRVPKVTYGMALMYSPFFLLGHKIAINQHSPLTGYSEPYATCVHYGSLFYVLLGLVILALVLQRFYGDITTAITVITIFFATNFFCYAIRDSEMTHSYSFFLISLFLWLTCKWHEKQKSIYFMWIGLTLGLLALIRPNEILIVIIFLGYNVNSWATLKNKLRIICISFKNIPLLLIGFFAMWLPQMIYWKVKTDSFLFFSYGSDERFFWADPEIINFLFSYRHGWLLYTPLMALSLVGIFLLKGKASTFKIPIIVYLVINIYVLSSWWCWWYGGAFGMRAMIQSYALLAIPLAAFYEKVFSYNFKHQVFTIFTRSMLAGFISFCLCLNLVQTIQQTNFVLHYDAMTKEAYWFSWGKFGLEGEEWGQQSKNVSSPDYEAARRGEKRH